MSSESSKVSKKNLRDVFKFMYVEAQVECFCVVCDTIWLEFPDDKNSLLTCPKCNRHFKFTYMVEETEDQRYIEVNP